MVAMLPAECCGWGILDADKLDDQDSRTVRRTAASRLRSIKAARSPAKVPVFPGRR
jgi:hypothetical protein